MKNISLIAFALLAVSSASAQNESSTVMNLNLNNGTTLKYNLSDIKDITFEEAAPVELPAAFALPSSFTDSYVKKVMAGAKQVAEIDLEYVKGLGQVTVVYPCDANGKAILTKGITSKGATVSWDAETKLPTVGEEGTEISKFYIVEGELKTSYEGETQDASVAADLLIDRRGTETQSYRLVKIGLKYWTADNIRATKYTDGTDITAISQTATADWSANTTGAYLIDSEADWVKVAGLLYNGYVAISDKMAPEGWAIPTCDDYNAIKTSVGVRTAALYKDSTPGTWAEGTTGNNQTGFSVVATGYYSTATGLAQMFSDSYIWTCDKTKDIISKKDALDFFRIQGSATNASFPNKGFNPHDLPFGHSIRFVRK